MRKSTSLGKESIYADLRPFCLQLAVDVRAAKCLISNLSGKVWTN
jgi:hypothetical protein